MNIAEVVQRLSNATVIAFMICLVLVSSVLPVIFTGRPTLMVISGGLVTFHT